MSATVTIPPGITVIIDDDRRHDLVPGTYPVHATTATGEQVPVGDRPHFLEVDLPTAGTTGIGVILVRIPAYEDLFPAQTVGGPRRFAIDGGWPAARTSSPHAPDAGETGSMALRTNLQSPATRWPTITVLVMSSILLLLVAVILFAIPAILVGEADLFVAWMPYLVGVPIAATVWAAIVLTRRLGNQA